MKRNRLLIIVGVAVLILTLVALPLAACAKPAQVEVQQWRCQSPFPAIHPETVAVVKFADAVRKDTGGMIDITVYPGAGLGYSREDVAAAVETGVLEIGLIALSWVSGSSPIALVHDLPFIYGKKENIPKALQAWRPFMDKEFSRRGMVNLAYWAHTLSNLACDKKVTTIEDWKGLKLRAYGIDTKWFPLVDAIPVSMTKEELYPGLASGVVQGCVYGVNSYVEKKLWDFCPYYMLWGPRGVSYHLLMLESKIEALPEDIQDVIWERAAELEEELWEVGFYSDPEFIKQMEAHDIEIISISESELGRMREITRPIWDEMLEQMGTEGLAAVNAALKAMGLPAYK